MPVNLILTPHILRNCTDADDVARKLAMFFAGNDHEGVEVVCVYPMPAAHPEGDEPQYDVTVILKQTVPATEG
jgi:hypothetical protein